MLSTIQFNNKKMKWNKTLQIYTFLLIYANWFYFILYCICFFCCCVSASTLVLLILYFYFFAFTRTLPIHLKATSRSKVASSQTGCLLIMPRYVSSLQITARILFLPLDIIFDFSRLADKVWVQNLI